MTTGLTYWIRREPKSPRQAVFYELRQEHMTEYSQNAEPPRFLQVFVLNNGRMGFNQNPMPSNPTLPIEAFIELAQEIERQQMKVQP